MADKNLAKNGSAREDRLKAALKANMARRKAQARARSGQQASDKPGGQAGKDNKNG